jgi:solute carrier family 38 (sodium-coupled neutral amino acid transporter), member 11
MGKIILIVKEISLWMAPLVILSFQDVNGLLLQASSAKGRLDICLYPKDKVNCKKTLHISDAMPRSSSRDMMSSDDENPDILPLSAEAPENDTRIRKGKVRSATFNLIKAIAGSGVLALPYGLATISDYGSSLLPAVGLMMVLGAVSAYTFALYGRLVHACQAKSLGELWKKEKNERSAWIVSVASLAFCLGACLSHSILLGDVSSSMAHTIGCSGIFSTRQFWIIISTTCILYPLCSLQSLMALAPLSLVGVAAVFMTTLFIVFRCPLVNAGSPYTAPAGKLLSTLTPIQFPTFNTFNNGLCHPSSLILFGMSASAYL